MVSSKTEYKTIDVEGLATALAEAAWKEDTKNVHELHAIKMYNFENFLLFFVNHR